MKFDKLCDVLLSEMAERDGEHVTITKNQDVSALDKVSDDFFVKTFVKRPRVRLPIDRDVVKNIASRLNDSLPSADSATREDALEFSKSAIADDIQEWLKEVPAIAEVETNAQFKSKAGSGTNYIKALNARFADAAIKILAMLKKTGFIAYPKLNQLSDAKPADELDKSFSANKKRGRKPQPKPEQEMVEYSAITSGSLLDLNKVPEEQLKSIHPSLTKAFVSKLVTMIINKIGQGKDKEDIVSTITLGVKQPVQDSSLKEISIRDIRSAVSVPLLDLLLSAGVLEQETRERPAPRKFKPKPSNVGMGKTAEDEIKDIVGQARYGGSGEADAARRAQIQTDYEGY